MPKAVFKFKRLWFDDKRVFRMLDRKTRKALSRFGGTARKHAQYSMRRRKGSAPPGEIPLAHGRALLRKLLFYSFDMDAKSVVVGPVRLDETADLHVPRLLEFGGTEMSPEEDVRNGRPLLKRYTGAGYMAKAGKPYYGRIAQWYAES